MEKKEISIKVKRQVGRPHKEIDSKQVKKLAMLHCTNVEIAAFFDVDESTIRKQFSDILIKGRELGKIKLRRKQMQLALSGDRTLLIWLGKQYLEQSEKVDHSGKVDSNITFIVQDLKKTNGNGK